MMGCGTHSKPASPVSVGSREGFSNKHSSPACLQRRQGGLSAPSQRIFCFLHAFYSKGCQPKRSLSMKQDLRMHLTSKVSFNATIAGTRTTLTRDSVECLCRLDVSPFIFRATVSTLSFLVLLDAVARTGLVGHCAHIDGDTASSGRWTWTLSLKGARSLSGG